MLLYFKFIIISFLFSSFKAFTLENTDKFHLLPHIRSKSINFDDPNLILTGNEEGRLCLFDITIQENLREILINEGKILKIYISPDEHFAYVVSQQILDENYFSLSENSLNLIDLNTWENKGKIELDDQSIEGIRGMKFTAYGKRSLFVNPLKKSLNLLDLIKMKKIKDINIKGTPTDLAITPDEKYVLVIDYQSKNIRVIKMDGLIEEFIILLNDYSREIKISPEGEYAVFINSTQKSLDMINLENFKIEPKKTILLNFPPSDIEFTPDGQYLLVATPLGEIFHVINFKAGVEKKLNIPELQGAVSTFSRIYITKDAKKAIIVWNNYNYIIKTCIIDFATWEVRSINLPVRLTTIATFPFGFYLNGQRLFQSNLFNAQKFRNQVDININIT